MLKKKFNSPVAKKLSPLTFALSLMQICNLFINILKNDIVEFITKGVSSISSGSSINNNNNNKNTILVK